MATSPSEETRWRSFRQVNRNRPFKQIRLVLVVVVAASLYGYALLCLQPQQSHDAVVKYSIKEARREAEDLRRRAALQSERRKELAKRREAARLKRLNRTAFLANFTTSFSVAKSKNTATTLTSSEKVLESQVRALVRFFGLFCSFIISIFMIWAARFVVRLCAARDENDAPPRTRRRRTARDERESRFREWARRLNRQRQQEGERPLSLQSLRLVVRGRDFSRHGNDYEGLLQFNEESGPAMQALLQSMGATRDEIDRCPQRVIQEGDDLLTRGGKPELPHCSVCLEAYQPGDSVRTIPCFHTFHTRCIDPWLEQKAVCPVCKHPAVA